MRLDPLGQISATVILATVAIFLVTFVLLRRWLFVPVIRVMEARARRVEEARGRRTAAEQRLAEARAEAEAALAAARADAARIAEQVRHEADERRRIAIAKASAEAESVLARGREEIVALRGAEADRLRAELLGSVSGTLARLLTSVDDAAVRLLVHRALESAGAG